MERVIVRLCCELGELVKPDRRLVSLLLAYRTTNHLPMIVSLISLSRLVIAALLGSTTPGECLHRTEEKLQIVKKCIQRSTGFEALTAQPLDITSCTDSNGKRTHIPTWPFHQPRKDMIYSLRAIRIATLVHSSRLSFGKPSATFATLAIGSSGKTPANTLQLWSLQNRHSEASASHDRSEP